MDGQAEWTEIGASSGLDHLAMLAPVEAFYQSLLPGFSSITTRMRNYAFHAWWITRNARTTKKAYHEHTRRVEALYALASAQWDRETGIAGARFALNKLAEDDDILDFRFETSLETPADRRYLGPPAGDFQGTYFGQMREIGLLARAAQHNMPVPTKDGERLADAYAAALPIAPERFFEIAKAGQLSRVELATMLPMAPSAIDQDGEEARLLREILMGEDGSETREEEQAMRTGPVAEMRRFVNSCLGLSAEEVDEDDDDALTKALSGNGAGGDRNGGQASRKMPRARREKASWTQANERADRLALRVRETCNALAYPDVEPLSFLNAVRLHILVNVVLKSSAPVGARHDETHPISATEPARSWIRLLGRLLQNLEAPLARQVAEMGDRGESDPAASADDRRHEHPGFGREDPEGPRPEREAFRRFPRALAGHGNA